MLFDIFYILFIKTKENLFTFISYAITVITAAKNHNEKEKVLVYDRFFWACGG